MLTSSSRRLEQPSRKGGSHQPGVPRRDLTAIGDRTALWRPILELGQQDTEPPGEVEKSPHALQGRRIDRAGVDRVADRAGGKEVDEQADTLDRC